MDEEERLLEEAKHTGKRKKERAISAGEIGQTAPAPQGFQHDAQHH
jgi:hypothetical protein